MIALLSTLGATAATNIVGAVSMLFTVGTFLGALNLTQALLS